MNDSTDWELLARCLAGECSENEKRTVREWINAAPDNKKTFESLQSIWNTPESQLPKSDTKKLWMEVAERAGISKAKKRLFLVLPGYKQLLRYAALLLLAISILYMLNMIKTSSPAPSPIELTEITVPYGERKTVTLADGTGVTLDSGSRFRYPPRFSGETRSVFLDGEGYFDVAPNKEKPFIVHANHAVITVVGTKFNVRAWRNTGKVNVAVAEGKVSLRLEKANPGSAVLLKKGQLSSLQENGRPSMPRDIDIEDHLGWLKRHMVFHDVPLQEILYQLERWYDIRIIPDENIPVSDSLTMHIEDKPLEDILELICTLTELKYKRNGRDVYLYSR